MYDVMVLFFHMFYVVSGRIRGVAQLEEGECWVGHARPGRPRHRQVLPGPKISH